MDPEFVFTVANILPLPVWATWILAPRSGAAKWFARSTWPWMVLGALYTVLIVVGMTGDQPEGGSFSSLAGVMALFTSPWGALAGWVHYLAFDLFAGRWIMNDAPDAGHRLAPFLFFTLMLGPLGLLGYLLLRSRLAPKPA